MALAENCDVKWYNSYNKKTLSKLIRLKIVQKYLSVLWFPIKESTWLNLGIGNSRENIYIRGGELLALNSNKCYLLQTWNIYLPHGYNEIL